jgi:hypothetical protein
VGRRHLVGDPDAVAGRRVLRADGGVREAVIPGRCEASNYGAQSRTRESRDSGSGPSDHPGMTTYTAQKEKRAERRASLSVPE